MGKVTGFIEWVRQDMGERPVHARLKDWAQSLSRACTGRSPISWRTHSINPVTFPIKHLD